MVREVIQTTQFVIHPDALCSASVVTVTSAQVLLATAHGEFRVVLLIGVGSAVDRRRTEVASASHDFTCPQHATL